MKAEELRIGNWVWNDVQNLPVKVDISILNQQYSADRGIGRSWNPIPLSEEILLKCGFEDVSTYKDYWLTIKNDKGHDTDIRIEISLLSRGRVFTQISDLGLREDLFYLHQLQNLYYALTGEELEVKL